MPEFLLNLKATGTEQFANQTVNMTKTLDQSASAIGNMRDQAKTLAEGLNVVERAVAKTSAAIAGMVAAVAKLPAVKEIAQRLPAIERYLPPIGAFGIGVKAVGYANEADAIAKQAEGFQVTAEKLQLVSAAAKIAKVDLANVFGVLESIRSNQTAALSGDKGAASAFIQIGAGNLKNASPIELLQRISGRGRISRSDRQALNALGISGIDPLVQTDLGGLLDNLGGLQVPEGQIQGLSSIEDSLRGAKREAGIAVRTVTSRTGALLKKLGIGTTAGLVGIGANVSAFALNFLSAISPSGGEFGKGKKDLENAAIETGLFRERLFDPDFAEQDETTERLERRLQLAKIKAARTKEKEEEKAEEPAKERGSSRRQLQPISPDSLTRIGLFISGNSPIAHRQQQQLDAIRRELQRVNANLTKGI